MSLGLRRSRKSCLLLLTLTGFFSGGLVWIHDSHSVTSRAVEGCILPEVRFKTLEGKAAGFKDYRNTPFLAVFVDLRCGSCEHQLVALAELSDRRGGGLPILVIVEESPSLRKESDKFPGYPFRVLLASKMEVRRKLGYFGIPCFFLVDRNGILVHKKNGILTADQLDQMISEAGEI